MVPGKSSFESMPRQGSARKLRLRVAVSVFPEDRRQLVKALAYFRAAQFRAVGADGCRDADWHDAQKRLNTVLECYCRRP